MSKFRLGDVVKQVFRSKQESDESPRRNNLYRVVRINTFWRRVIVVDFGNREFFPRYAMDEDTLKKVKQ